jgi:hypothetical protein
MSKRMKIVVVLSLLFAGACVEASQMDYVTIDENGNGTWTDAFGNEYTFTGSWTTDPSGGTTQALVYDTSVAYLDGVQVDGFTFNQTGDYKIITYGTASDVAGIIRFYGDHTIIFYDNDQGIGQSIADGSGFPTPPQVPSVSLEQTLSGNPSQTIVTPFSGMPGYVSSSQPREYTFLSVVPVPEPGLFSLLACGVALLGIRRKRPVHG